MGVGAAMAQNAYYQPAVGDHIEVIRRVFGKDHSNARRTYLNTIRQTNSRDGLVRMVVITESRDTGEMVVLIFSDAENRGNWKHKAAHGPVEKYTKKVERHEFRIFETLDEGVSIRAGRDAKLYWHKMQASSHDAMREALANRMLNSLKQDRHKANGYMAESETEGMFLGLGIGTFGPQGRHASTIAHLKAQRVTPVKRDHLKIVEVIRERRK
jgi:hypothetical protein